MGKHPYIWIATDASGNEIASSETKQILLKEIGASSSWKYGIDKNGDATYATLVKDPKRTGIEHVVYIAKGKRRR